MGSGKVFNIKLMKRKSPHGKYVKKQHISLENLKKMYSIYAQYYANTKFSIFQADFEKKQGAILIFHPETNEVVGFSTVAIQHLVMEGKRYTFVFTGDTIVEREFWGHRTLVKTYVKLLMKLRLQYPFDNFYWLLISKGYKTYLLLANNCYVYYPHFEGKNGHLKPIVEQYCHEFFAKYYEDKTGLLNFGDDYQPLKGEVAPITDEMRRNNPKISFFEQQNPTWRAGTELPCVGGLSWTDLMRYPLRYLTKPVSEGKKEVAALPAFNHMSDQA